VQPVRLKRRPDEAASTTSLQPESETARRPRSGGGRSGAGRGSVLPWMLAVLAIVAAGVTGYLLYEEKSRVAALQQEQAILQSSYDEKLKALQASPRQRHRRIRQFARPAVAAGPARCVRQGGRPARRPDHASDRARGPPGPARRADRPGSRADPAAGRRQGARAAISSPMARMYWIASIPPYWRNSAGRSRQRSRQLRRCRSTAHRHTRPIARPGAERPEPAASGARAPARRPCAGSEGSADRDRARSCQGQAAAGPAGHGRPAHTDDGEARYLRACADAARRSARSFRALA
jgi:hypothetical protein